MSGAGAAEVRTARRFVLWLDAVDGSVPTHDGVQWPDGTATLHHRNFNLGPTATVWASPETASRMTYPGGEGRVVWIDEETQS